MTIGPLGKISLNLGQLNLFYGLVLEIQENSDIFYEFNFFFTIKNFYELF